LGVEFRGADNVVNDQPERETHDRAAGPGPSLHALTDSQLLEAFVRRHEAMAFTTIVERHGPLVWQVCRRYLFSVHDAEDAFQATFLVLAQKAGHIGKRELLANWLHGVANHVARRARSVVCKRNAREGHRLEMAEHLTEAAAIDPNVKRVVHEEISRLPDKYRAPVLLCYLESRTHEEAARELKCPLGTVKGRLFRALETLRTRLSRRGLMLSLGFVAAALKPGAEAATPAALLQSTARLCLRVASRQATVAQIASPQVAALSKSFKAAGRLPTLVKVAAGLVALLTIGGVVLWFSGGEGEPTLPAGAKNPGKVVMPWAPAPTDKTLLQGTWKLVSVKVGGEEIKDKPQDMRYVFAGDKLTVLVDGWPGAEYTFTAHPSQQPKNIDFTLITEPRKGAQFPSVYELNGDVLKVCMPAPGSKQRPWEVASRPGSSELLMTLQREAK
jgi:RNA polymerase sigma factor (sigma-70 family)